MKAVVAAFNQEKALVGAFSVITNIRMQLFEALLQTLRREPHVSRPVPYCDVAGVRGGTQPLQLDAVGRGLDSR